MTVHHTHRHGVLMPQGSDALQPKVPRRKAKLAEHRKQRKLKAKGRGRAAAEEGARPAGVTTFVTAS